MRFITNSLGVILVSMLLAGCTASPRFTSEKFSNETNDTHLLMQEGVASYYADEFNGRQTSNGETYDMNEMTAAHQTLPFSTRVRVTNIENGRTVIVRINDRGPFKDDRIIDLSLAAAKSLELIGPGTARVKLEVVELGNSSIKKP